MEMGGEELNIAYFQNDKDQTNILDIVWEPEINKTGEAQVA